MKKKKVKEIEYDGLGFPILLTDAPIVEVHDIPVPDIDYNMLQKTVFFELSQKPCPLTGNEVRFIRQFLGMTYVQFAKTLGVTHPSVIHWEKSGNEIAKINLSTELCIRLYILTYLGAENKLLREAFQNINEFKLKRKMTPLRVSKPKCP